jgi:hypothetical protein
MMIWPPNGEDEMTVSLVLAVLISGGGQAEDSLRQTLADSDTAALARVALPNGADVVRHDIRPAHPMDPPAPPGATAPVEVRFYTAPQPTGDGVCGREVFHVSMSRATDGGLAAADTPLERSQVRLDPACASAGEKRFAWINPGMDQAQAAGGLSRLKQAQDQAAGHRHTGLKIRCLSEVQTFRCPTDTTALFAELPLDGAYLIENDRDRPGVIRIGATEGEPGGVFWDIRLDETPEPTLTLRRAIPAPF